MDGWAAEWHMIPQVEGIGKEIAKRPYPFRDPWCGSGKILSCGGKRRWNESDMMFLPRLCKSGLRNG